MNNVVLWKYLRLRIAFNERRKLVTAYYEALNGEQSLDELAERCRQSDARVEAALAQFYLVVR